MEVTEMGKKLSRREFVKGAAVVAAGNYVSVDVRAVGELHVSVRHDVTHRGIAPHLDAPISNCRDALQVAAVGHAQVLSGSDGDLGQPGRRCQHERKGDGLLRVRGTGGLSGRRGLVCPIAGARTSGCDQPDTARG